MNHGTGTLRPARSVSLVVALAALLACRSGGGPSSPEALRDAYARALTRDDPAAAYALLSPELRATSSKEAFIARWKSQTDERAAAQAALDTLPRSLQSPQLAGETTHDGAVLTWAVVGGRYQIVSGLPGLPDLSTPASAVRAFIAAIR